MPKAHAASIKVAFLVLLAFVILAIFIGPKLINGSEGQGRSIGTQSTVQSQTNSSPGNDRAVNSSGDAEKSADQSKNDQENSTIRKKAGNENTGGIEDNKIENDYENGR